jgi:hypothetical protein
MRGCPAGIDKGTAGGIALETPEFLRRNHHNFIAAMYGDVLWPLAMNFAYEFTETRLRILQWPMTGARFSCRQFPRLRGSDISGHNDQNTI